MYSPNLTFRQSHNTVFASFEGHVYGMLFFLLSKDSVPQRYKLHLEWWRKGPVEGPFETMDEAKRRAETLFWEDYQQGNIP